MPASDPIAPGNAPTNASLVATEVLVGNDHPLLAGQDIRLQAPAASDVYGAQGPNPAEQDRYTGFQSSAISGADELVMPAGFVAFADVSGGVTPANRLSTVVLVGAAQNKFLRGTVYKLVSAAPAAGEVQYVNATTLKFAAADTAAFGDDTFIEVFNNDGCIHRLNDDATLVAGQEYYDAMYDFITVSALTNLSGISR